MTDPDRPSADRLAATRSIPELVSKLIGDVTTLVAKEGDLIRSEINDKIVQLQAGVGKIAAGGILLLVALLVVANALVDALAGLLGTVDPSHGKTGWAAVIVSGVFGAIGALLVRSGTADLAPGNLKPDRTALQMRRDKRLAEDQVR